MQIAIVVSPEPGVQPLGLGGNFKANLSKAVEFGYEGVELFVGAPHRLDAKKVKELVKAHSLQIPAVGTGLTYTRHGLSFTSPDRRIREKAVERVRDYIKLGNQLGSNVIIGSIKGRCEKREDGWANLRDCVMRSARVASDHGVHLLIEPLNRYESNIINTLREALELIESIGSESIKILGDTFHMNIEERSLCESLREAKKYLYHVHLADSNRQAPGQGHLDFRKILDTLGEIGFKGFGTVEILPLPDQYTAAKLAAEHLRSLT